MTDDIITPLRERMMEDMRIRGMGDKAQKSHIRAIKDFAKFLKRSLSRTFLIGRFMYHAICPLLFSTCEGLGSRRRVRPSQVVRLVGAVHAACFLSYPIPFPLAS